MRILIADDETPIREWIQFSIERGNDPNYQVVAVAENGDEAFELALRYRVDTVITDIKMPGMNGLILMKRLLEEMPYVSFIILTNYAEFSYAREAITYGAKKYFLKSELRGENILEALSEIREGQLKLLAGNEEDCYSSGYLDLYTCYEHMENIEFIRNFWQKHHFQENLLFRTIAVKGSNSAELKQKLDDFIKLQQIHFLRPVLRKESVFLIMQAEYAEQLTAATEAFCYFFSSQESGIVVAGQCASGVDLLMREIEHAERMLQYSFFHKKGYFRMEEVKGRNSLNREEIKKEYHRILNSLLHGEEHTLCQNIDHWFSAFEEIAFSDVGWARDTCIKFATRIEEIFLEHSSRFQEEQEINRDWTFETCRDFCKTAVSELYSNENVNYSQSVREAIQYIHNNYSNQDISLKEAAQSIYRSQEYLSRIFKSETGKNFSVYLTIYRLNKAKELLLSTDMKIYEIAYTVGYSAPSYFSKIYHEYMGVTPEITRSQQSNRKSKK